MGLVRRTAAGSSCTPCASLTSRNRPNSPGSTDVPHRVGAQQWLFAFVGVEGTPPKNDDVVPYAAEGW
jgi:hypothetical protein